MSKTRAEVKRIEQETLATFQEEIPSIYYSDKSEVDYQAYKANAEQMYRYHFKFPPKMFQGSNLIDFGAGTGENTVYLANWGATCTLVEMNESAQLISKDVFRRYTNNIDAHRFVHSSIFDYTPAPDEQYDIVLCRGVLSHTGAKEEAFQKISSLVKPDGYLIFGDPNKAGGFQNMLQRYAVYQFAETPDEMVDVCEVLFKEDIDRSQNFVPRTRRSIIFDRWVIQRQDDPSLAEIVDWIEQAGLQLYSCYPGALLPVFGDSVHHRPRHDPFKHKELLTIPELIWMLHTDEDAEVISSIADTAKPFANALETLSSYMAAFSKQSSLDSVKFAQYTQAVNATFGQLDPLQHFKSKLTGFLQEANEFIQLVQVKDLDTLRSFVCSANFLFQGACGVRHIDIIVHRPC